MKVHRVSISSALLDCQLRTFSISIQYKLVVELVIQIIIWSSTTREVYKTTCSILDKCRSKKSKICQYYEVSMTLFTRRLDHPLKTESNKLKMVPFPTIYLDFYYILFCNTTGWTRLWRCKECSPRRHRCRISAHWYGRGIPDRRRHRWSYQRENQFWRYQARRAIHNNQGTSNKRNKRLTRVTTNLTSVNFTVM